MGDRDCGALRDALRLDDAECVPDVLPDMVTLGVKELLPDAQTDLEMSEVGETLFVVECEDVMHGEMEPLSVTLFEVEIVLDVQPVLEPLSVPETDTVGLADWEVTLLGDTLDVVECVADWLGDVLVLVVAELDGESEPDEESEKVTACGVPDPQLEALGDRVVRTLGEVHVVAVSVAEAHGELVLLEDDEANAVAVAEALPDLDIVLVCVSVTTVETVGEAVSVRTAEIVPDATADALKEAVVERELERPAWTEMDGEPDAE